MLLWVFLALREEIVSKTQILDHTLIAADNVTLHGNSKLCRTQWRLTNLIRKSPSKALLFCFCHICYFTSSVVRWYLMKLYCLILKSITGNIEPNWANYSHKKFGVAVWLQLHLNLTRESQKEPQAIILADYWLVVYCAYLNNYVQFQCQRHKFPSPASPHLIT